MHTRIFAPLLTCIQAEEDPTEERERQEHEALMQAIEEEEEVSCRYVYACVYMFVYVYVHVYMWNMHAFDESN